MEYQSKDILELCIAAARNEGATEEMARSLAAATVAAQEQRKDALGVLHFFDYLDAIRERRIDGQAEPKLTNTGAAVFVADARQGIPHVAFDRSFDDVIVAAKQVGVAVFSQKNSYTCGALGYFTERIAAAGLICLAATNSSAHMAAGGASSAVFGTNPLSFAVPTGDGTPPLVFDQASSQTALVSIREAARKGEAIPEGWAVDESGKPTTEAAAALAGALLPFGGYKGGNIALMVEMLATLSGAKWSLDAGFFDTGIQSPNVGMFIIAIDPNTFDPNYSVRVAAHLERLRSEFGMRFPGDTGAAVLSGTCHVQHEVLAELQRRAKSQSGVKNI